MMNGESQNPKKKKEVHSAEILYHRSIIFRPFA